MKNNLCITVALVLITLGLSNVYPQQQSELAERLLLNRVIQNRSGSLPKADPISGPIQSLVDVDFRQVFAERSLRLLEKQFSNWQGHDSAFSVGKIAPISLSAGRGFHAVEVDIVGEGRAAPVVGVYSRANGRTTQGGGVWAPETYGGLFIATNLGDPDTTRTVVGVQGSSYIRSPQAGLGAGGEFNVFTGGNQGAVNPTPLYGVRASAFGGHSGTSPLAVAGWFNVTNLGGGGVGNITEGIAVHALFDGGGPVTNYGTAKGIALQGWGPANGGSYTNTYGIYADTSIDRGTANRYFIYSLARSPSLFSGVVSVADDVYVTQNTKGLILKSPDGTCYRFTVANGGTLNRGTTIACP